MAERIEKSLNQLRECIPPYFSVNKQYIDIQVKYCLSGSLSFALQGTETDKIGILSKFGHYEEDI